jgi:hypothetical protein
MRGTVVGLKGARQLTTALHRIGLKSSEVVAQGFITTEVLMASVGPTEKQIENSVLSYLKMRGIFVFKNQSVGVFDPVRKVFRKPQSKHQIKGASDILGVLPGGRFLAIEVKAPKGRPTKEQMMFLDAVNRNGGLGFIARSIEDVEEVLAKELQAS